MRDFTIWENTATATLLVWMIKADGYISENEKLILREFISDTVSANKERKLRNIVLDAQRILAEPISTEKALNIARTIKDENHIHLILSLTQLIVDDRADFMANPNKNEKAFNQLKKILDENLNSSDLQVRLSHPLKRIVKGQSLYPLPSIPNYLKSLNDIDIIYPKGFELITSTWDIGGRKIPAWMTELGLAGKKYINSFYAYKSRLHECQTGILLLPGGFVDFRAYAKVAASFAQKGILCVVQNVPLGFSLFDNDHALSPNGSIRCLFPEINHWCLAGHSLGGVAAAKYIYQAPDHIDSLMLWGSFPAVIHPLKNIKQPSISISGTHDGLVPPDRVWKEKYLLPLNTKICSISGANHTQFGDYWDGETSDFLQYGDHPAGISREIQLRKLLNLACNFLKNNASSKSR